ncbi:lactosylceramide 4-alpha-galactosyltransferase-like [Centruroides sculpturatus]|uniref:lactosylceramide 4-alpha-galactosyltransferase-like n=1 Tax=Centruroides sculpturatus TaxID=218467 RepID=UPI000C6E13E9|nr:lactosylceramide 4-alpha-galactosyltransferase-like [Centruroides sculpturatus]
MNKILSKGHFMSSSCSYKNTRKLILAIICLLVVSLLLLSFYGSKSYKLPFYFSDYNTEEHNIFFVETSNSSSLNIRQACAVESTARHYPSSLINVLMFTSNPDIHINFTLLPNVRIQRITFEKVFENTPLLKWYIEGKWNKSDYEIFHLSDAIRYALIWKYGGMYLDLDIVMLKTFPSYKNFVIRESNNSLCNGIFAMERNHTILYKCMEYIKQSYDSNCFACIGPLLFTEEISSFCHQEIIDDMPKQLDCNITVFDPITAFPVYYTEWCDYFSSSSAEKVLQRINNSVLIHLWNKLSKNEKSKPGSGSAYELSMATHCPLVYEKAVHMESL